MNTPIKDDLALFTEAQIAILNEMKQKKFASKKVLARQERIVENMVMSCSRHGVEASIETPRLAKALGVVLNYFTQETDSGEAFVRK